MLSSLIYRKTAAFNIASLDKLDILFKEIELSLKIILLKGAALLRTVYAGDIGARHLGDVDILVRKEDFSRLRELFRQKGYVFNNGFAPARDTCYLNSVTCRKEEKFWPPIHIHWHLSNAAFSTAMFTPRIDLEKVWGEALPLSGFKDIRIMSIHHQLIHLGEHALKHSYDRPYLLEDIGRFIEYYREGLCWEKVVAEAGDFNLTRPLYYTLYFAQSLRGARVPSRVLTGLKPEFTFLEKRFIAAVRKGRYRARLSDVVYLEMNKTRADKIRYVLDVFFPGAKTTGQIRNTSSLRLLNPVDYSRRVYKGLIYLLGVGRCLF